MATSAEYIEFVMDSIMETPKIEFRYKKMFGEYCVYANEKPILLVCDNTVFVKMIEGIEPIMRDAKIKPPYEGAKPHYMLDIDDAELTQEIVKLLEKNTPLPKPKKRKTENL